MLAIKIPIREVRSFAILSQFKSNSTSGTLSATLPDIYNPIFIVQNPADQSRVSSTTYIHHGTVGINYPEEKKVAGCFVEP